MPRILVVDDSPVDRKLICGIIQRQTDWDIAVAVDGQEALSVLHDGGIDLVLTDLQMPRINGLQLVKAVRKDFNHIPVVLITAYGSETNSLDALRAGASNFTPKSSLSRDLVPTVKNVLEFSCHINSTAMDPIKQMSRRHAFVLDNDMKQIAWVIESLDGHLPNWAADDRLRISMALDEALTNAICYGNLEVDPDLRKQCSDSGFFRELTDRKESEPYCDRRIRIQADFNDTEITFSISDDGPGFDPALVPDPTTIENRTLPGGRGLLLIRTFMDEVSHNPQGNQIRLVKRRS